MASRRTGSGTTAAESALFRTLGESIGAQLGKAIAESVQRTLERSVGLSHAAGKSGLAGGKGKPGRRARGGTCGAPGCNNPVLAKGLCRSHYYKARYQAQQAGTLKVRKRK